MIITITLRHDVHPSDRKSNIIPIPFRNQPKIPPPVNTNAIIARIPIRVNNSILMYIICCLQFFCIVEEIMFLEVEILHY